MVDRHRATAIALARRQDRWQACQAHLESVLPAEDVLPLDMFEGSDAKTATLGAAAGEEQIVALERTLECSLYRGWPITEIDDVRRCFPALAACGDDEAWMRYERAMSAAWRPDRARLYVDFFNRHLSLGEMGASLSHYRVAERAYAEGLELQLVFEDDARPTVQAVPALLEEVESLRAAGVEWDLIYLHSAPYGRRAELRVPGSNRLYYAGHRKVCHAYALSARGARKLATCGYRRSALPYDDFLPALHAGHPRPDVMALPCVRAARGEAPVGTGDGASDEGEGEGDQGEGEGEGDDEGGAGSRAEAEAECAVEGFVAFTFADEPALCVVPQKAGGGADSDSKAGRGSSVLLGDLGVGLEGTEDDGVDDGAAPRAEATTELPPVLGSRAVLDAAEAERAQLRVQLQERSYARVRVDALALGTLRRAELAARCFFSQPAEAKARQTGPGGRDGDLLLWSCGFSSWPHRQQWHVVCGAPDAQPWPTAAAAVPPLRPALLGAESLLREIAMACLRALDGVDPLGAGMAELREGCEAMGAGTDPSVLDAFYYAADTLSPPTTTQQPHAAAAERADAHATPPAATARPVMHMAAHLDPGVLTLTRASECPGIQIYDAACGAWLAVEALAAADEVLVFAGEQLEKATCGRVRAARHRVASPPDDARASEPRNSVVFELRAPGVN